jgi:hypothetical protein
MLQNACHRVSICNMWCDVWLRVRAQLTSRSSFVVVLIISEDVEVVRLSQRHDAFSGLLMRGVQAGKGSSVYTTYSNAQNILVKRINFSSCLKLLLRCFYYV